MHVAGCFIRIRLESRAITEKHLLHLPPPRVSLSHRTPSNPTLVWIDGCAAHPGLSQIDEALPHLAEAVSIDPESAKYRHTLGLAKCATGDEAGAREELLEAALLDEEDAEDRYQLRMQRISEKRRRNDEQQRMLREPRESEEAGTPQVRNR